MKPTSNVMVKAWGQLFSVRKQIMTVPVFRCTDCLCALMSRCNNVGCADRFSYQ